MDLQPFAKLGPWSLDSDSLFIRAQRKPSPQQLEVAEYQPSGERVPSVYSEINQVHTILSLRFQLFSPSLPNDSLHCEFPRYSIFGIFTGHDSEHMLKLLVNSSTMVVDLVYAGFKVTFK